MKSWQWKWKNRESMTTLRKKNKAFHSNVIDKLQKMCEKYPFYAKGLIVVPKTITRQRGNRLQTFIPRSSERRRLMLQQEGKWLAWHHHFIFKNSIVVFQFPCNRNERMNENVLSCTRTMLGLNSPCEIRKQPFQARPLSLKIFILPFMLRDDTKARSTDVKEQLQEDRSSTWFSLSEAVSKLR